MALELIDINKCKTLFLDRDGVINVRIIDGYVTKPEEFIFIDGVLEAMSIFSRCFEHIFIVSNQQGIGKGLMSKKNLDDVHGYMCREIKNNGGNITKIYYCPHLAKEYLSDRKPDIGMGLRAKYDFPDIIFNESIMVGDAKSDMSFGRHLNMKTVFIGNVEEDINADLFCDSLLQFAKMLE